MEPVYAISSTTDGYPNPAYCHLGNRNLYPAQRYRRSEQHHADYCPRTHTRVWHPQSLGSQTRFHPLADYLGKCDHHDFLRLHRHGGRHCRDGIHESGGRQTDHGHGCIFDDLFRKPNSRLIHRHRGYLDISYRRYTGRTLPGKKSSQNPTY